MAQHQNRFWIVVVLGLIFFIVPIYAAHWKYTIGPNILERIFLLYGPSFVAFLGGATLPIFFRSPVVHVLISVAFSSLVMAGYIYAMGHINPWMGLLWFYIPWFGLVTVVGVGIGSLIRKFWKPSENET